MINLLRRAGVVALAIVLVYLCYQPDVARLQKKNPKTTALIELRIKQARKAKTPFTTQMIWRDFDDISPHLVHAVLLAEDDRFYDHHGFDLNEIWEAVKINWRQQRWAY